MTDGSRGQLVVVVALVVATVLVGLALVLNSGIYAENLSTRDTTDASEVTAAVEGVFSENAAAMRAVNRANLSESGDAVDRYEASSDEVADAVTRDHARRGVSMTVRATDATAGYSLQQPVSGEETGREFTPASGAEDEAWMLAEEVDRMAGYRLSVDRDSLAEPGDVGALRSDAFHVRLVDDGGVEWRVYVYRDGDDVVVTGGDGAEIADLDPDTSLDEGGLAEQACRTQAERASLDLVEETLDDADCAVLSFTDHLTEDLELSYGNPTAATGGYRLLVAESAVVSDGFDDPETAPFRAGAVFAADVEVIYESSDVRYVASRTVTAEPLVYGEDS